jgi:glycosyltransferase involved in cell wall biosynthesis
MHRSGTSALARTLGLLGADLPANPMASAPDNVTGFWEPEAFHRFHEAILGRLGSAWDDWRALDLSGVDSAERAVWESEISKLLDQEFGASKLFVLKEPRICRLAPFYTELLIGKGIEPRAIISLRNPLAVIASLAARNGMTEQFAALLWLRHVLDAEAASRGRPRVVVSYERLLSDWERALGPANSALGIQWPRSFEEAAPPIRLFLNREHCHHAPTEAELSARKDIPSWIKDAYGALRRLEHDPESGPALLALDQIRSDFGAAASVFGEASFPEFARRQAELASSVEAHARVAANLRGIVEARDAEIAESDAHIDVVLLNMLGTALSHAAPEGADASDAALIKSSGLFHDEWYAEHYPDVPGDQTARFNHFVQRGAHEGRKPNPLFDSAWYMAQYPEVAASNLSAVSHYIRFGAEEGRLPSSEVADIGITEIDLAVIRAVAPVQAQRIAIIVAGPDDTKDLAALTTAITALQSRQFKVILVWMAETIGSPPLSIIRIPSDGLVLRLAVGHSLMAWGHLLIELPELMAAAELLLLDYGACHLIDGPSFGDLLDRASASSADVVSATAHNSNGKTVLDSYFLAVRKGGLSASRLMEFCAGLRGFPAVGSVLSQSEEQLSDLLRSSGRVEILFPFEIRGTASDLAGWTSAVNRGYPFIPLTVLHAAGPKLEGAETLIKTLPISAKRALLRVSVRHASLTGGSSQVFADLNRLVRRRSAESKMAAEWTHPRRSRVSFIGPWNIDVGLGFASRGYVSALWQADAEVNLYPVCSNFHVHTRSSFSKIARDFEGPSDVCVVHLNPDAWPGVLHGHLRTVLRNSRHRVGLWVWETEQVPEEWFPTFAEVDAIWTPSEYCRNVLTNVTCKPVHVLPHVITASSADAPPNLRHRLGLPADRKMILYSFDGASFLVRKNPHALVRAFQASGLENEGWMLVLKAKNLYDNAAEGETLAERCRTVPSVHVIDRQLSSRDQHGLFADCEIYASPHCSEGFGLTIAEAMALGKLVVATDYGGSRDFLDSTCGFPVAWAQMTLDRDYGPYRRGHTWASVDEVDLSRALKQAAKHVVDPAGTIRRSAAERIKTRLSPAAVARQIETLLGTLSA